MEKEYEVCTYLKLLGLKLWRTWSFVPVSELPPRPLTVVAGCMAATVAREAMALLVFGVKKNLLNF